MAVGMLVMVVVVKGAGCVYMCRVAVFELRRKEKPTRTIERKVYRLRMNG